MANTDSIKFLVERAIALDQEKSHENAAYYYEQAASSIQNLLTAKVSLPQSWTTKISEYQTRAAVLRNSCKFFIF